MLSNINQGLRYRQDDINYPIRKNYNTIEDYSELIYDIVNTTIPFTQLLNKYNYSYSTIKKINEGTLLHQENLSYPLRKIDKNKEKALQIIEMLQTTNLTQKEIAEKLNCDRRTVSRINCGISYHDENINYPIR